MSRDSEWTFPAGPGQQDGLDEPPPDPVSVTVVLSEADTGRDGVVQAETLFFARAEDLLVRPQLQMVCHRDTSPHRIWFAAVDGPTSVVDDHEVIGELLAVVRALEGVAGTARWTCGGDAGLELPSFPLLDTNEDIRLLNLTLQTHNRARMSGLRTVGDVVSLEADGILELEYIGRRSLEELEDRLLDQGYLFGRHAGRPADSAEEPVEETIRHAFGRFGIPVTVEGLTDSGSQPYIHEETQERVLPDDDGR